MPNRPEKQIEIKLTSAQTAHIFRQGGLKYPVLRMGLTELRKASLIAVAAAEESLPVTQSAIEQMWKPGQNSGQGSESFTIDVSLTSKQKEQIRQATGKNFSSLRIVPDDIPTLFKETWDTRAPIRRVGRTLVIKRADETYETSDTDRIINLPLAENSMQNVFGTGRHPTTQLALILLEEYVESGDRVLDLGTGSGILGVAAARLGASEVLALDTGAAAVAIAQETVSLNNLTDVVGVGQGSIESAAPPFDLVVANIFPKVIIELAPNLATTLQHAGVLITSGSVVTRAKETANAVCAAGFTLVEQRPQDNWVGMVFRKQ